MILMKKYHIVCKDGLYHAVTDENVCCPCCGGSLRVRDSKKRGIIMADGKIQVFLLRRLKCGTCGALHLELPDIFIPYKRYSRDVIERASAGRFPDCPAENSTIYRWSRQKDQ